jgi:predicted dehydrogenase
MAKQIVESGRLGRIYHYRARFFTDRLVDPNFPLKWRLLKDRAGSGPISDLGSHSIDLARFILGEVSAVSAATRTFINERPLIGDPAKKGRVTVEDATAAVIEFENGALGTLEISKFVTGRKNYNSFEINGEKGSLMFDTEKCNELLFYATEGEAKVLLPDKNQGIRQIWPTGFMIGFSETFIGEIHHFIDAIVNDKKIEPYGASFEDGYRNCVIVDAILKSAEEGKRITIQI